MPLTSTCRIPVGSSAVSRSPSAGKSRTRRVGPVPTVCRIEHAHVGPVALTQVPAPHEAEHVGGLACEFAHRLLERHDLTLAHPLPQQVGGQRRVAQLVDVRTRVGQSERHVVVREQVRDRVDVVVGDVRAEAGLQILGDRHLAQHVERAASALGREVAHPAARPVRGTVPTRRPRRSPTAASSATPRGRPPPAPAIPDRGTRRCVRRDRPASARRTPCRC